MSFSEARPPLNAKRGDTFPIRAGGGRALGCSYRVVLCLYLVRSSVVVKLWRYNRSSIEAGIVETGKET